MGSDPSLENALYHATDPQAAFAVLHAFDDPDLNTMLVKLDRRSPLSDPPAAHPPAERREAKGDETETDTGAAPRISAVGAPPTPRAP